MRQIMIDNVTGAIGTIMTTLDDMTFEEHEALEELIYSEINVGAHGALHNPVVEISKDLRTFKEPEETLNEQLEEPEELATPTIDQQEGGGPAESAGTETDPAEVPQKPTE